MKKTYALASLIALCLAFWMSSGFLTNAIKSDDVSITARNLALRDRELDSPLTPVRTIELEAAFKIRLVKLRGETDHKREVLIQTQLDGLIEERPIERGDFVEEGQLLCQISTEDRQARLIESEAQLEQARLVYSSNQKLAKQGLLSDSGLYDSRSQLKLSEANFLKRKIDMGRLNVIAPFSGFIEELHAEEGQFVTPGMACATLVDLDPILIRADLSELKLKGIEVGRKASISIDGFDVVPGRVSFVSQVAKPGTKTFEIEIEVQNQNYLFASGLSADVEIALDQVLAHRISPSLLLLNDQGKLGLRSVLNDLVLFHPVQIIDEDGDGVWVTGLPKRLQLITVGQHAVSEGERVTVVSETSLLNAVEERG